MSIRSESSSPAISPGAGEGALGAGGSWSSAARRVLLASSLPVFLAAWQLTASLGVVNRRLFPGPVEVAAALGREAASGVLWIDLGASLARVAAGYAVGAAAGVAVGVLTARSPTASRVLAPLFHMLRPIPPIALVPIVILWFGLSELGKLVLVSWGVFFTVWLAAHLGVARCDELLVRAASSLGAKGRVLLWRVVLPGAMPTILVGLRTAVGISFYTLVAAELAGTFAGVAYRIDIAHQNMQTAEMMAGLVVLGLISAAADRAFDALARRFVFWR